MSAWMHPPDYPQGHQESQHADWLGFHPEGVLSNQDRNGRFGRLMFHASGFGFQCCWGCGVRQEATKGSGQLCWELLNVALSIILLLLTPSVLIYCCWDCHPPGSHNTLGVAGSSEGASTHCWVRHLLLRNRYENGATIASSDTLHSQAISPPLWIHFTSPLYSLTPPP